MTPLCGGNYFLFDMSYIIEYLLSITADIGYLGIVFLMAIESSFVPFPSEVIIPPAAYLAALGEMNIYLVVISGIVGSLIGASVNYFLAFTLGRKVIYALANKKIAKLFLINQEKIQKAEKYFIEYGSMSTFIGRLVPAVRQLVSIPAGFSKMDLKKFFFFTALGSGLWTVILAILGYVFGANQEVLEKYYSEISIAAVTVGVIFIVWLVLRNKKPKNSLPL